jgi:hypothetical protein
MFGNKRKSTGAEETAASAPIKLEDESEAVDTAADDDRFAQAVWLGQIDQAFHDPSNGSVGRRIARIVSYGAASGFTDGQIEALKRLAARVDEARDVLGRIERRLASGRCQVSQNAGGPNF